jgi:carbon-monoxide dehydrogenase medium subunit
MRPQGVALPIINMAVWLERDGATIRDVRIAVGPGGPTPWRARDAEHVLTGRTMSGAISGLALDALLENVEFRTSARRASRDYRRHLVVTLFKESLACAWDRAGENAD